MQLVVTSRAPYYKKKFIHVVADFWSILDEWFLELMKKKFPRDDNP